MCNYQNICLYYKTRNYYLISFTSFWRKPLNSIYNFLSIKATEQNLADLHPFLLLRLEFLRAEFKLTLKFKFKARHF